VERGPQLWAVLTVVAPQEYDGARTKEAVLELAEKIGFVIDKVHPCTPRCARAAALMAAHAPVFTQLLWAVAGRAVSRRGGWTSTKVQL
jgi:hypothetical protein